MQNKLVIILVGAIILLVAALAFTVGRQSSLPTVKPTVPIPSPSPAPVIVKPTAASKPIAIATLAPTYPRFVSEVPVAFRGRWDEIVSDRCEEREARFYITATTVNNFEVKSDVSKVKQYNSTEADISITGYDEENNQYNDVMMLKVVDSGKTLTGRKGGAGLYRKCP